jgi:hypothetical protein
MEATQSKIKEVKHTRLFGVVEETQKMKEIYNSRLATGQAKNPPNVILRFRLDESKIS